MVTYACMRFKLSLVWLIMFMILLLATFFFVDVCSYRGTNNTLKVNSFSLAIATSCACVIFGTYTPKQIALSPILLRVSVFGTSTHTLK